MAHLYHYRAVCVRVVDADTLDLHIDLGFHSWRYERIRLARVNAWEVRGPEREKGLLAKARVEELMFPARKVASPPPRPLLVRTLKDERGKYGRYVAEIEWEETIVDDEGYVRHVNLSDLLVTEGHARLVGY